MVKKLLSQFVVFCVVFGVLLAGAMLAGLV